ncbi:MAG: phospholipase D-like domain-containing protein [Chitinophagales bacterium]|nr:phospholipase D-like domain-containing protein [Chitinophagales bacterium]
MEQVLTDGHACKAKIIESISQANSTIKVAMAYFTDRDIADALITASKKDREVTVVLSDDQINKDIIDYLKGKLTLIIYKTNGVGIMHYKFCIIDKSLLLHGSYNFTYNATKKNKEYLNITDSYNLISEYSNIFDSLTKKATETNVNLNDESIFKLTQDDDYLKRFYEQLENHISYIFDDFNYNEIVEEGRKLAEENLGAKHIFLAYLDTSLARVNAKLNQADHIKTLVKVNMTASLERAVESNDKDLEMNLKLLNNHCNVKKSNFQAQIDTLKSRVTEKQEDYNKINADVFKVRATITELTDEIDNLNRQIVVRPFWTFPTVLKLFLTTLFFLYLSLFFSSAIWKIFFEEAEILKLLSRGIIPESPPLFDANALVNIFSKKGVFYGTSAALFFLVPVLLTSIKLLSNKNKYIEIAVGWVIGIFAIDVVVAILISQHTFEIKRLLVGGSEKWELGRAFATGEFWLIFIFGALPLFLTKVLIENIWLAYNKSNPELVDRERTLLRNSKRRMLLEKQQEFEVLRVKLDTLNSEIDEIKTNIRQYEDKINEINSYEYNKKLELQERNEKRNKNLREVYNSFISSVESGDRQFLKNVVSGRISAFKTGFYNWINSEYHPIRAAERIERLEIALRNWENDNFN